MSEKNQQQHLASEFVVANSATEAVEKLEGLLAKLRLEAAAEQARGAKSPDKEPSTGGIRIEDATPDFNPDDVIAQLMAASKGDRAAATDKSDSRSQSKVKVKAIDTGDDEVEVSSAAARILRRYKTYFEMEINGAHEAMQRGDTEGVVNHVYGAELLHKIGHFLIENGDSDLAKRQKSLKQLAPLLGALKRLLDGDSGSDGDSSGALGRDTSKEN